MAKFAGQTYVIGYEGDVPIYWKDRGEAEYLTDGAEISFANDIAAMGSWVYIAGEKGSKAADGGPITSG